MLPILAAALAAAQPAEPPPGDERACGERIEQVRDERGLPRLDRGVARPDEPLLIAALDKRIDGCPVLVMRKDTSDIRPLPISPPSRARLRPAR